MKYVDAIRTALDDAMAADPSVIVMGLDVDDHKAIQGSTLGLVDKYGVRRVFGTPLSEDAMTGIAIGAAMTGLRPIHVHIRMDFLLLAMNQLVNVAAKASSMYGGHVKVPLVVRAMIGKSWGQGAQHSQGLQSLFMHIPGLKVVAPSTPRHAYGCLRAAIEDDNPVIFVEHRLLYGMDDPFLDHPDLEHPDDAASLISYPAGRAFVARSGTDITIVAISSMVPQAIEAAKLLAQQGISAEVIDPVWLQPLDMETIIKSLRGTRHLLVVDNAWLNCGASAEIVARVAETLPGTKCARMGFAATPCPTTPWLEDGFYPNKHTISARVWAMLRPGISPWAFHENEKLEHEAAFVGPF
jgi:pyruvate/2-oxoglutarate/acetoin dehydrogenase E1 component